MWQSTESHGSTRLTSWEPRHTFDHITVYPIYLGKHWYITSPFCKGAQIYLVCQTNNSLINTADYDCQTSQLHLITVWNQEHSNPSHPHPHQDHRRHIFDDHHQPCALVVPKPARPSKQGGSSAAGVWASTVAQRAAALDSLWQLRRAAAVYNSCGNCRRDNRFPNSDARCALVPADTVLPEKACVQCFARITRPFNSYSQITFLG